MRGRNSCAELRRSRSNGLDGIKGRSNSYFSLERGRGPVVDLLGHAVVDEAGKGCLLSLSKRPGGGQEEAAGHLQARDLKRCGSQVKM